MSKENSLTIENITIDQIIEQLREIILENEHISNDQLTALLAVQLMLLCKSRVVI